MSEKMAKVEQEKKKPVIDKKNQYIIFDPTKMRWLSMSEILAKEGKKSEFSVSYNFRF